MLRSGFGTQTEDGSNHLSKNIKNNDKYDRGSSEDRCWNGIINPCTTCDKTLGFVSMASFREPMYIVKYGA